MTNHAADDGWITAQVTAGPGVAEHILDKATLAAEHLLPASQHRYLTGISIAGFALQTQMIPPDTPSWWRRATALLDILERRDSGLVVVIDEVHRSEADLRPLFQHYQELVNDRRNVAVVMAGLPSAVEGVLSERSLTFVQRAHRQSLGPIDTESIRLAYQAAITQSGKQIAEDVAALAAQLSEGYPYMYQLIGYLAWQASGQSRSITEEHLHMVLDTARDLAGRNLYGIEVRALTHRERAFLGAMLRDDGVSTISAIAGRLGITGNNANYYRHRLVARGLIEPATHGSVRFVSSYLRAYLDAHMAPTTRARTGYPKPTTA